MSNNKVIKNKNKKIKIICYLKLSNVVLLSRKQNYKCFNILTNTKIVILTIINDVDKS